VRLPKSGAAEWGGWRQWAFIATGLAAGFVSLAVPGDTRFASWAGAGMGGLVIVLLAAGGARASSDHSRWDAAEAAVSWLVPRAISRTLVNQGRLTASLIRWVLRRQPADTGPLFGYARPLWAATWAFVGLTVFEAVLVDGAVYIAAGDSPWLWGVLAFHVYCVVWLVAVYASAKVVPHQVADAHLILNDGCFAVATVPYTALQSAVLHKRPNFYRSGMKLDLTDRSMLVACSDANVRLVLEPATGPFLRSICQSTILPRSSTPSGPESREDASALTPTSVAPPDRPGSAPRSGCRARCNWPCSAVPCCP